jgi:hypothetical protein
MKTDLIILAMQSLEHLLDLGKNISTMEFATAFESAGGVQELEQLQDHASDIIYSQAVKILELYFGGETIYNQPLQECKEPPIRIEDPLPDRKFKEMEESKPVTKEEPPESIPPLEPPVLEMNRDLNAWNDWTTMQFQVLKEGSNSPILKKNPIIKKDNRATLTIKQDNNELSSTLQSSPKLSMFRYDFIQVLSA